jgi:hypothetical protein
MEREIQEFELLDRLASEFFEKDRHLYTTSCLYNSITLAARLARWKGDSINAAKYRDLAEAVSAKSGLTRLSPPDPNDDDLLIRIHFSLLVGVRTSSDAVSVYSQVTADDDATMHLFAALAKTCAAFATTSNDRKLHYLEGVQAHLRAVTTKTQRREDHLELALQQSIVVAELEANIPPNERMLRGAIQSLASQTTFHLKNPTARLDPETAIRIAAILAESSQSTPIYTKVVSFAPTDDARIRLLQDSAKARQRGGTATEEAVDNARVIIQSDSYTVGERLRAADIIGRAYEAQKNAGTESAEKLRVRYMVPIETFLQELKASPDLRAWLGEARKSRTSGGALVAITANSQIVHSIIGADAK